MSSKRLITKNEIEDILSFIKPQGCIPIEASKSIVNENKKQLREQLKSLKIYPQVLPSLKLMIEKQYMEAKIQAGESVGVIGAQSIGEKQTQTTLNSVDYTDKILYILNDKAIVEPVGKMIDNILEKNKEHIKLYQNNNTEYLELPEGYFIPSGDENGYNEWLRIEAVTRHLPSGKLVKVTTQSGRNVMASQSKSFLVWNGEKFVDTLGSEVKIGDILPTTKNMPMVKNQTKYFDMYTIFPKHKYLYSTEVIKAKNCKEKYPCDWFSRCNGKDFITPYKRPDTLFGKRKDFYMEMMPGFVYIHTSNKFVSHIPEKILLDNNFGFLIGIYLAEGWCTKTFVGVSNNDEIIRKRVTDFCDCYGVTYHLVTSKGKNVRNGTSNDLKIHSTLLARMFKIICDTGSANKFVPDFAYTAPKEFITGLIDGYFSGDGCVTKTGSITVSSVSEQLIQGISFLLSYMGIFGKFSSFQQKKNNVGSQNIKRAYILDIRNCFAQKFAKEIKMTEGNKQKRLEEIILKKIYRYKFGKIQEKYPKDACRPYYHTNAQIDNFKVNVALTSGTVTAAQVTASGVTLTSRKPFDIPHPNKEGWRLRHVCLEGPESGVYYRGRLTNSNVIELPAYWKGLVDPESITVTLTQIGSSQDLIVDKIEWGSRIVVKSGTASNIDCYFLVHGERKDGEKLIVEYEGKSIEDYPGNNSIYSINK